MSETSALSPENILTMVRLINPQGILRVRGRATRLTAYPEDKPEYCYGFLQSINGEATLIFKCPIDAAPEFDQQLVVIEGTVISRFSKYHDGLEIVINGSFVEEVTLDQDDSEALAFIKGRGSRTSIDSLLQQEGSLARTILLGSTDAISELVNALPENQQDFAGQYEFNMDDVSGLDELVDSTGASSIIFLRSESETAHPQWDKEHLFTPLLERRVPFYAALSFKARPTLTDSYSDQSFESPEALGEYITQIYNKLEEKRTLDQQVEEQTAANKELLLVVNDLKQQQKSFDKKLKDQQNTLQNQAREQSKALEEKVHKQHDRLWKFSIFGAVGWLIVILSFVIILNGWHR